MFVLGSDKGLKRRCSCRWLRNRKQICVPLAGLLCECATASEQPGNERHAGSSFQQNLGLCLTGRGYVSFGTACVDYVHNSQKCGLKNLLILRLNTRLWKAVCVEKKHEDPVSSFICIRWHGRKIKYTVIILQKQPKFSLLSISVVWNSSGFRDEECEVFPMLCFREQ